MLEPVSEHPPTTRRVNDVLSVPIDLTALLARVRHRYPSLLIDAVAEHEPGVRLVVFKNVTVNEDFFPGHFPGAPVMPAVLMIEALAQVAAVLVLEGSATPETACTWLRGVNNAKFRRQVIPGDRLRLEVRLDRARSSLARLGATAYAGEQRVAEAELVMARQAGPAYVDPTARVHPTVRIGTGTIVGPHCTIGPDVRIGRACRIGASAVIEGWTEIGDGTQIFPMASIGLAPQDLKYRGERTKLVVGRRNVFREFVTINRGTLGGGGETRIGDDNLFMAYVHVAHDCRIGNGVIFGPGATLGGHVVVEDFATVSAYSGVHQFCRVGQHGFIGGYSVITKDALPFGRSVGNRPARMFGLNTIGLVRRGFSPETVRQLRRAFRYLLSGGQNTSQALRSIDRDPLLTSPEVRTLVDFIRTAERGVVLRRPSRPLEDGSETDDE